MIDYIDKRVIEKGTRKFKIDFYGEQRNLESKLRYNLFELDESGKEIDCYFGKEIYFSISDFKPYADKLQEKIMSDPDLLFQEKRDRRSRFVYSP